MAVYDSKRNAPGKDFIVHFMSFFLTSRDVLLGILNAAKSGRTLPRLTVLLPCQLIAHCIFITERWQAISCLVISANIILNVMGYAFLILLYRHSIQVIFNRKIPAYQNSNDSPQSHPAIQSFNTHLLMLRPLEILFRFLTAPLRVLPDIIVLGEVRCGTTNLCAHLSSFSAQDSNKERLQCYAPFCPWAHPELDNKESFYFVGHYLGIVDPYFYRMAFPLIFTRWWEEFRGNVFFTFDGCAQYLSSPTAPYLIAHAYKRANTPPPVLVACVRNPVDQAISWWQYENNAMIWGESMGLTEWNTNLRSELYPPKTIVQALEYSQSTLVQTAYKDAKVLIQKKLSLSSQLILTLPPWALTWPGGQLSVIGKGYSQSIYHYNDVFQSEFGQSINEYESLHGNNIKVGYVYIATLESQETGSKLKSLLRPILSGTIQRSLNRKYQSVSTVMHHLELALGRVCSSVNHNGRRNSNPQSSDKSLLADSTEHIVLNKYFKPEAIEMESMLGIHTGWIKLSDN